MKTNLILLAVACLGLASCKKKDDAPVVPVAPVVTTADANGVIESWQFDGNLSATRRSTATFTTANAPTATATDRKNAPNKALLVPANASLTIDNLPLPQGDVSRTISCWVHFNADATNTRYFVSYGTPQNGKAFGLSFNAATSSIPSDIGGYAWGGGSFDPRYPYTPSPSANYCAWSHLAFVYDKATFTLKFYRDGTLRKEFSNDGINTVGTQLIIGAMVGGSSTGASFKLDDLTIYNRALTAAEITTISNDTDANCR